MVQRFKAKEDDQGGGSVGIKGCVDPDDNLRLSHLLKGSVSTDVVKGDKCDKDGKGGKDVPETQSSGEIVVLPKLKVHIELSDDDADMDEFCDFDNHEGGEDERIDGGEGSQPLTENRDEELPREQYWVEDIEMDLEPQNKGVIGSSTIYFLGTTCDSRLNQLRLVVSNQAVPTYGPYFENTLDLELTPLFVFAVL